MINWLNSAVTNVCGLTMRPLEAMSAWAALVTASCGLAVLAMFVFKYGSNQDLLRRRREQALAHLLELHLFKDDLLSVFSASGRIFAALARYTLVSLKPLSILLIPCTLLLIQLSGWFEHRPLKAEESTVLTVQLDATRVVSPDAVSLKTSEGIGVETAPFISAHSREIAWRIRPQANVIEGWVEVTIDGQIARKSLHAGGARVTALSSKRVRDGAWLRLLHPFEERLPADGAITSIALHYPARKLIMGSHRVNWILALVILSMGFGALLKVPMRVEL